MARQYKVGACIGICLGFLVAGTGAWMMMLGKGPVFTVGRLGLLAGFGLLIWGCSMYARMKGRHPGWGLLALAMPLGLMLLVALSDRRKAAAGEPQAGTPGADGTATGSSSSPEPTGGQ